MFLVSFFFTINTFVFMFIVKVLESRVATMYVQQQKTPDDLLKELYASPPPEGTAGHYNPGEDPCKLLICKKLFIFYCIGYSSDI